MTLTIDKLRDTDFMEVRLRLFEYSTKISFKELLQKTLDELEIDRLQGS